MDKKKINLFVGVIAILNMILSFRVGNLYSAIGWTTTFVYSVLFYRLKK